MRLLLSVSLVIAVLILPGCHSPGANCRSLDGWQQGRAGSVSLPGCVNSGYREAHELGSSLRDLEQERLSLDARIAAEPESEGALRRRQRQLDIDIEAIRALAVIEGWQQAAP